MTDSSNVKDFRRVRYDKTFNSQQKINNELDKFVSTLHELGYAEASIDTVIYDSISFSAYIFQGKKYFISKLFFSDTLMNAIQNADSRLDKYSGNVFSYMVIYKLLDEIVCELENKGFPFASVKLDSVELSDGEVNAAVKVETGAEIFIDSLIGKGNVRISRNYICRYLGIKHGDLYKESKMIRINERLINLPFVTVAKPHEIAFYNDRAVIYLYLNKKKASTFSGVVGVLPDNRVTGRMLINGEAKLKLLNSFAKGELIDLKWRSLSKGTQDLNVHLNYPYIFNSPFGIDYEFSLYKKDTIYTSLANKVGIQYNFIGTNFIKAYGDFFRSDLNNTSGMENLTILPDYADISTTLYGLEVNFNKLDYRLNPSKGYEFLFNGAAGIKNIRKNSVIPVELYDSITLKSNQYRVGWNSVVYQPVYRKNIIVFAVSGGGLINNNLFLNELFRVGGLNSLKGFDEESIYASLYCLLNFEYRYLFERNSYLALFWNGAYIEQNIKNIYSADYPYGFGAGISFETRVGVFSLYYALGSQNNNPIYFKQSKVHFGISNTF